MMKPNILLAAGSGSRMSPLTDKTHKSMLEVNGVPLLKMIIDNISELNDQEIVVVTGHKSEQISDLVNSYKHLNISTVYNSRYQDDVNIYSVNLGVSKLNNVSNGYNIIETDIILEPACWQKIYQNINRSEDSFWVTHGKYSKSLTGGIVHANVTGVIDGIAYAPSYMPVYEQWPKMLGIVSVGPNQVEEDIQIREELILKSIKQYYLTPWVIGFEKLPSRILDVSEYYAKSFNDEDAFNDACSQFLNLKIK